MPGLVDVDLTAERAISKAKWRLMSLILLLYFIAFVDRVNVGFAALTMNKDLGLTPYIYGWGAGIFFFGYFIFEVPSNLALERFGTLPWAEVSRPAIALAETGVPVSVDLRQQLERLLQRANAPSR